MHVKFMLWHTFPGCGTDQLRHGEKILSICARSVDSRFKGLTHRSNVVTIPIDNRMVVQSSASRAVTYPQEWHMQWKKWVRSTLLVPTGFGPTRFAIGVYLPATKELNICSEVRHVSDSLFALRLTSHEQQVFLLAERQVILRPGGIFGGTEESAKQLPEQIELY